MTISFGSLSLDSDVSQTVALNVLEEQLQHIAGPIYGILYDTHRLGGGAISSESFGSQHFLDILIKGTGV